MDFDFTEDRGPAKYFHGRKQIIDTFNSTLRFYRANKRGTIFLIQGAPGAGKTALLDVLSNQAKPKGWAVADISVEDLYTPASMAQSLGKSYTIDSEYALKEGIKFIEGGIVESVAGHANPREILKHLSPETGLILLLDEAQHLNNLLNPQDVKTSTTSTLNAIHNGELGKPVMLLTAGLSTTETALSSLGVSRFVGECTVQLGRLDKESECAVIRDWLTQSGGGAEDTTIWVEAIAEKTHGWPQHIISYVKPALKYLKSSHGKMTDRGLEFVIESGNEFRLQYYDGRAHDIDKEHRVALARAVMDVPIDGTTTRTAIIHSLKQSDLTQEEADALFKRALEQGILDKRKSGKYGIPIPSLHRWLIDEYIRNKSHDIPPAPKQLPAKPEQFLLPTKKDDESKVKKNKGDDEDKRKGGGGFSMER